MQVLTDPADCGPVTLSLCQDVQAEAYDYPESFFAEHVWHAAPTAPGSPTSSRPRSRRCKAAKKPVIIAGGGVLYSRSRRRRCALSPNGIGIPVMETQGRQIEPAA